ncbi:unnamed protein product [Penicillium salamii]|uniref:Zn(2)-C6 fungal-type domain-containing protein n=1 Tax=Penicillium salamii TaxID=1612424 RepID=A0A9W4J4Y9_9EURO|nr:unnamed protein product [Penicillium salamii]CAG8190873.1 unnamed protein product [Penicillium salamii]CAG8259608.1 unnamed protein product [Penicillium salamii]CAG8315832.1 unnamed protein product [Penicillium salamii]CAG8370061.1 unnamed protein product [Penicillium salamii]
MSSCHSVHIQGQSQSPGPHRRTRKPISCDHCRYSKLRCDRQQPCGSCKRRGRGDSCFLPAKSGLAPGSAKSQTSPVQVPAGSARTVEPRSATRGQILTASPGSYPERVRTEINGLFPDSGWGSVLERPVPQSDPAFAPDTLSPFSMGQQASLQNIIELLPPENCRDYLVSHYFNHICALFPILHGPSFEKQYTAFRQQPLEVDLSWLALLFSMCALTLSATEPTDPRLADLWSKGCVNQAEQAIAVSRRLQQTAMACLLQDQFFTRYKFSTFEALLMLIYHQSHNESVDQGWALLGMALNIGIALRCNVTTEHISPMELERRRRCWAGLLTLHTYQSILFRDVDMTFLLEIKASMPADVNDSDITDEGILQPSSQPTQMSLMMFKLRLFHLSAQICRHISGPSRHDQGAQLRRFDDAIAAEQKLWDSKYMINGSPKILNSYYAHWCILQTYAHHLFLLLHRPFHHSQTPSFIAASRERCINSAAALISIHRDLYEVPLLRNFLWLINGVVSLQALHAAVALNSCLRDMPSTFDTISYRDELQKLMLRMQSFSSRSKICSKAYHVLDHLQAHVGTRNSQTSSSEAHVEDIFEDWTDMREWFDDDLINWVRSMLHN